MNKKEKKQDEDYREQIQKLRSISVAQFNMVSNAMLEMQSADDYETLASECVKLQEATSELQHVAEAYECFRNELSDIYYCGRPLILDDLNGGQS